MTNSVDNSSIEASFGRILRPLVKLLLRNGIGFADFTAAMRTTYIEVAGDQEFMLAGKKKQSVARIAVLTGINRKEVKNQLDVIAEKRTEGPELLNGGYLAFNNNVVAAVISSWRTDSHYVGKDGKPRRLSFGEDKKGGFEELVKKHSKDMTPRSVLDELERLGAVEKNRRAGSVKLISKEYLPIDEDQMMRIGSENIGDLLKTVIHNIDTRDTTNRRFQRRVYYDNIPKDSAAEFRPYGEEKAQKFLEEINLTLASRDRDQNPGVTGEGRYRVGFGVYYFEENISDNSDNGENESHARSA